MWMNFFQQFQRWSEGHTSTACLGRLNNEEQLVGLAFVTLRPFAGSVADAWQPAGSGDGWLIPMRLDPALKRKPDEGCWVALRPFPISRDGNVQLDERLGQHHSQAVIGNHAMD